MNEIIATAPRAFWAFALGGFSGLVVMITCFARLGSRVSGVKKNLIGLRDEMRAGFSEVRDGFAEVRTEFATMRAEIAEVNKNLSRLGECVAKTEARVDGWLRQAICKVTKNRITTNSPACAPNGFQEDVPTC